MKVTLSVIKADVGSIGGPTKPTPEMMDAVRTELAAGIARGDVIDGRVTHTGDDIAIIMSHTKGVGNQDIHVGLAWKAFISATNVAKVQGNYGAGQDLLVDAPSGNVRGAGPDGIQHRVETGSERLKRGPYTRRDARPELADKRINVRRHRRKHGCELGLQRRESALQRFRRAEEAGLQRR